MYLVEIRTCIVLVRLLDREYSHLRINSAGISGRKSDPTFGLF